MSVVSPEFLRVRHGPLLGFRSPGIIGQCLETLSWLLLLMIDSSHVFTKSLSPGHSWSLISIQRKHNHNSQTLSLAACLSSQDLPRWLRSWRDPCLVTPYKANVTDNLSSDVASKLLQLLTFFRWAYNSKWQWYTIHMPNAAKNWLMIIRVSLCNSNVTLVTKQWTMESRGTNLCSQWELSSKSGSDFD